MSASPMPGPTLRSSLAAEFGDLGLLAVLLVLASVLTAAMVLQFGAGEVPCPLCLLERVAMFGICFGLMRHFRPGGRARGIGLALVFAVLLLVISGRQTLLDICPRPGHAYVGSAVLGLHMPVWSGLVALAVIAALAAHLAVVGAGSPRRPETSPRLARAAGRAGLYVTALCAINLASVLLQCGFGACHTGGYQLP